MTPAQGAVVVYRLGLWRVLLVVVLVLTVFWRYFVAPVLDGIDRVTPWDGALPGSCIAPAPVRPAGWSGMSNDAGRLLRGIADGPPSPERMVGWFRAAGQGARSAWVVFDAGTQGQQLLPLASVPQTPARQAAAAGALSDQEVAALALEAGWPVAEVPHVVARVRAESGGNPLARDYADGTHHGLLQLGTAEQARYLEPGASAFDPRANLSGALRLWKERGWQPWAASDSAVEVQHVTAQPVGACTAPQAPQGQWVNGQMPDTALAIMPGGQQLRTDAAAAFAGLSSAYAVRFGQPLVVRSGYRTYAEQAQLKRQKPGLAASAGRSQHGLGLAADIDGPAARFRTVEHEWLRAHGGRYGWVHPTWAQRGGSKPEPWHWEYVGAGQGAWQVLPAPPAWDPCTDRAGLQAGEGACGMTATATDTYGPTSEDVDVAWPTVTAVPLDRVVNTLTSLREHREAVERDLTEKRAAIREYAVEAKAAGVSGRQLSNHLTEALRERGWSDDQIRQVGISPGAVSAILDGT